MARIRSNFETANARLKLPVRKKSYSTPIAPGIQLLYRRNLGAGAWSVKTKAWMQKIAVADDFEPANGGTVLNYWDALTKARELARIGEGNTGKLITVAESLDDYEADLKARGGQLTNATTVRHNMPEALLSKTVAMLKSRELSAWRNGLVDKGLARASADRIGRSLKAALNLAARHDKRIANAGEWREALGRLPGSNRTRDNVILDDRQISTLVAALHQEAPLLGLWGLLLAQTGARESQCVKLKVRDLQDGAHKDKPRLMMPTSLKGKNREQGHRPVTITPRLAKALRLNAKGRKPGEPLIDKLRQLSTLFRPVLDRLGHGPEISPYSLRHSSIVRQLLQNVPIRVVASFHDSSVGELERVYSRFISDVAGDLTRATLSDFEGIPANIVPLRPLRA